MNQLILLENMEALSLALSWLLVLCGGYFAWRFISCFMVFMKSLHAHTAFVTARAMQAHGYTTDAELAELKQVADAGGHVAATTVKCFTLAVLFIALGLI